MRKNLIFTSKNNIFHCPFFIHSVDRQVRNEKSSFRGLRWEWKMATLSGGQTGGGGKLAGDQV
jgi:hypothetical protein